MKLSEVARQVINLARTWNQALEREGIEITGPLPTPGSEAAATMPVTAEEQRLRTFLEGLSLPVISMVSTIYDLGREDFDTREELVECYEDTRDSFGGVPMVAWHLMSRGSLPELLENGLKRLAKMGVDVDTLLAELNH